MSSYTAIKFINNKCLRVDAQIWFGHLQDIGDDMTEEEKTALKKTLVKQFFYKGCFYKHIYELALTFYTNLQKNKNLVQKLSKNKFNTVKHVSKCILLKFTKYLRADVHSHPEGAVFLDLWESSKRSNKSVSIFILLQFYQFWVPNECKVTKPTPDDKLSFMGILLSNQVCEYLSDIMGFSAGEN